MFKHSKILALFLALTFAFVVAGIAQHQTEETVVCPVSGKEIKKSEAKSSYEYEGKTYYFCCPKCKDEFKKNPDKYTHKKMEMKEVYTCPMHPKVKSDEPGKCPECGMKLEKKMMHKEGMHACKHKKEKAEGKSCSSMMEMMMCKDVEMKVENIEGGVVVKITSKNEEAVKMIQKMAAKMKSMCTEKAKCSKKEEKKKDSDK